MTRPVTLADIKREAPRWWAVEEEYENGIAAWQVSVFGHDQNAAYREITVRDPNRATARRAARAALRAINTAALTREAKRAGRRKK